MYIWIYASTICALSKSDHKYFHFKVSNVPKCANFSLTTFQVLYAFLKLCKYVRSYRLISQQIIMDTSGVVFIATMAGQLLTAYGAQNICIYLILIFSFLFVTRYCCFCNFTLFAIYTKFYRLLFKRVFVVVVRHANAFYYKYYAITLRIVNKNKDNNKIQKKKNKRKK